jgi:hypothetical protein
MIECTNALFFVAFLNHGRLEADMIVEDDLEVDTGSAGVVMMVVGSTDAIRRRIEREVLSRIKLNQAVQVSYGSWIGRITDYIKGCEVTVVHKEVYSFQPSLRENL